MMRRQTLAIGLMLLAVGTYAQTDVWRTDSLQEVVVTGTGTRHLMKDAPVQTEVITNKMLSQYGGKSLEDILAGIEKGLLIGGFSGGQPGTNGEFSGVAKNSFLIEHGRVTRAVTETMINGNLGDMLQNVRGISKETDDSGLFSLPYLAVDGIVISGK